jgi:hypothetical protein
VGLTPSETSALSGLLLFVSLAGAQDALRLKQRLLRTVGDKGNDIGRYSHSVLDCCTIDLIYPALQGVDLIFEKWTSVGVNSALPSGLTGFLIGAW